LKVLAAEGKSPGEVVVSLDGLVGRPEDGAADLTFRGNLLVVRAMDELLERLGARVSVEGRPELVEAAAALGLRPDSGARSPEGKRIVMATRKGLEARGLQPGEGAYVIRPQTPGEVRALRAEMLASGVLSAVRSDEDAVDERLVRHTAYATGSDQGKVRSILQRLAVGNTGARTVDSALLAEAEEHTALPPLLKVALDRFLGLMRKLASELASWA
jgi:hypothetical protein